MNSVIVGVGEHVECYALKDLKLNIFKIIDQLFPFIFEILTCYHMKLKLVYLKLCIQEFHRKYVLNPPDKSG